MTSAATPDRLVDIESKFITHAASSQLDDDSFCCGCVRPEAVQIPEVSKINIGQSDKKVLVLDLDETLVHCSFYQPDFYDLVLEITIDQQEYDIFVQKRPNVDEFLKEVMKDYHVIIFTASLADYANPIIDELLPGFPQSQRMFRESCTFLKGMYIKDLEIFKIPLGRVLIVDNNPCSFALHPQNAVLSETWEGAKEDTELMDRILPLLNKCSGSEDVREVLANPLYHHVPRSPLQA